MPFWGDEAFLGLNVIRRDYGDLLRPLDLAQVAPGLFLWIERFVYVHLGMSEWALRLPQMVAGIGALFLFWRWARLLARPLAAAMAVGIVAVGHYLVRYGVEFKPYAFDLLASTALLLPATHYLISRRLGWMAVLIAVTPVCLLVSYPSVFVAGGIAFALLFVLWRSRWTHWVVAGAYAAVVAGVFFLVIGLYAQGQYDRTGGSMLAYWKDAFPPGDPIRFAAWIVRIHTGNMFAYPFGGKNGASILSVVGFLIGLVAFRKERTGDTGRALLALLLVPFALTFVAAAMHRYPYGESARVAQHLAPAIIVLIGVGIETVILRSSRQPETRRLAARIVFVFLLLLALGGMAENVAHPYKTMPDFLARRLFRDLFREVGNNGHIVVLQPRDGLISNFQWYLSEHEDRVIYDGWNEETWRNEQGKLRILNLEKDPTAAGRLRRMLGREVNSSEVHDLQLGPVQTGPSHWELLVSEPAAEL